MKYLFLMYFLLHRRSAYMGQAGLDLEQVDALVGFRLAVSFVDWWS